MPDQSILHEVPLLAGAFNLSAALVRLAAVLLDRQRKRPTRGDAR